jgi:hypothetical protein
MCPQVCPRSVMRAYTDSILNTCYTWFYIIFHGHNMDTRCVREVHFWAVLGTILNKKARSFNRAKLLSH